MGGRVQAAVTKAPLGGEADEDTAPAPEAETTFTPLIAALERAIARFQPPHSGPMDRP